MSSFTRAVVVAGAIVAVTGSVRADAQILEPLRFQTTFPFTVEHMTFPAGHYTLRPLEMDPYVFEISNGSTTKLVEMEPASWPSSNPKLKQDDEVMFKKTGDQYVLTEVWDAAEGTGAEPIPAANQDHATATHQGHRHRHG